MPTTQTDKMNQAQKKTIRCGVFTTIDGAERAVNGLLEAGFGQDRISVLCSDESKERHFRRFQHEKPAGSETPSAAATGGAIGAIFGALVSAGLTTLTGLPLIVAGPSFIWGGGVAGGLIGAMQTRGHEKALADFYDQSLTEGKLLVGVEDDGPDHEERLDLAEKVFLDAGAEPVPLSNQE